MKVVLLAPAGGCHLAYWPMVASVAKILRVYDWCMPFPPNWAQAASSGPGTELACKQFLEDLSVIHW